MEPDGGNRENRRRLPRLRGGRLRFLPPEYFDRSELVVNGVARTYWVPPVDASITSRAAGPGTSPSPSGRGSGGDPPPLLIAFHGLNSSGSRLAWWSGLDKRGPEAGFHCVFPDGVKTMWDDHGCGRRDGAEDLTFIARLVEHLAETGAADPERVFVTGVSRGSTFAERVVRSGAVDAKGVALVTGTARVASRGACPAAGGVDVLLIAGTDDPILPWAGGASRGPLGKATLKTVHSMLVDPVGDDQVAPLTLAAEWAMANRCEPEPSVTRVTVTDEGFAVDRLRWAPMDLDRPAVSLYRIAGGGHGWPDARQYLPTRMLGRIPQGWDGTGVVLDFATAAVNRVVAGREAPESAARLL